MSRLPGVIIASLAGRSTCNTHRGCDLPRGLRIQAASSLAGQVIISASGHGMLTPFTDYRRLEGPFPLGSTTTYALADLTALKTSSTNSPEYGNVAQSPDADPLVYAHTDLRQQNVLIYNGKLSGIVDWEDSGWLPMGCSEDSALGIVGLLGKILGEARG
ncbi:hypothetical protein C8R44DRAFT_907831 [Mycena epipterygia]|nr:hypothetical protein C8R44DRAFT_907831 [Mycena epipterygia]